MKQGTNLNMEMANKWKRRKNIKSGGAEDRQVIE